MGKKSFNFIAVFTIYFVLSQFLQNWCLLPERKRLYLHMIGYSNIASSRRQLKIIVNAPISSIPVPKSLPSASQST